MIKRFWDAVPYAIQRSFAHGVGISINDPKPCNSKHTKNELVNIINPVCSMKVEVFRTHANDAKSRDM